MSSEVLISDSKEFRDFLFNHRSFVGQHFSTYDVSLYLDNGVASMLKYVLWSNPDKPNSFYISYLTFDVTGPTDTIMANIEVNYLNGDELTESTAYDIKLLSQISCFNDPHHWEEFTIKTKVACSLFTISDIIRLLEVREGHEMCRYYTEDRKFKLEHGRVSFTLTPFNKFKSQCSVFCEKKAKGKSCEKRGPWPLWKMAAFLVHETLPLETILEKVPEVIYPYVLQCNISSSDIGHKGGIYKDESDIEDIPRLMDQ